MADKVIVTGLGGYEFTFDDSDVANVEDCIFKGEYNPLNIHPWLLHDAGCTLCVVFASGLQEALDVAVNESKLDGFLVDEKILAEDYGGDEEGIARLGDAGEPFDIGGVDYVELENPPFSFAALYNAREVK